MNLAPGARLGAYEIHSLLGAGGMGEVYKATDTRLDRTVAIKVLPEHVASDPDLKQRFEREAKTLAALSHPHICPVFDVGSQGGIDFLVMEYLEGETLEQRLKKGALPLDQALQIGIQIADALAAAHRAGITHRDLKPGNIMLTKSGAKLLDFGLAKTRATAVAGSLSMLPTTPPNLTAQGAILGTFQYMAPEQLEGHESDARTDIFAFGALLYEIVTGKKAFEGKSQAGLIAAILEREPPAMSTSQPLTPTALDHVVNQCLAKEPDERWQTAGDILRELKWIVRTSSQAGVPARDAMRLVKRERLAWMSALTLAAMIAVGMGLWALRPSQTSSAPERRVDIVTPQTSIPNDFALSPDGRWLAFVATVDGQPHLWLRSLEDASMDVLKGTATARSPFWSPDSRSIGFVLGSDLKRIGLADRTIRDLSINVGPGVGVTASWNQDDVILFARTVVGPVHRFSVGTSRQPVAMTTLAADQSGHGIPRFLPDGRHYLYQAWGVPEATAVYVGSVDGGEPKRLLDADGGAVVASDHVLFVRQGALLAQAFDMSRLAVTGEPFRVADGVGDASGFLIANVGAVSASATGAIAFRVRGNNQRPNLVWFDRTGKEVGRIADAGDYRNPALSVDGRRLVMSRVVNGNQDVWVFDVNRNGWTRATSDAASDSQPVLSPDGQRVAFFSPRQGGRNLYVRSADGTGKDELVLTLQGANTLVAWSPDSRFLIMGGRIAPDGDGGIWAVPIDRSGPPLLVVPSRPGLQLGSADISSDGKWIAYESTESGRPEIHVQPFLRPGPAMAITTTGGAQLRWGGNGKELFYIALDGRLMAVPIRAGPDDQSLNVGEAALLFATKTPGGVIQVGGNRQQYVASPDGARFLVGTEAADSIVPPITLVLNWRPQ